MSTMAMGWVLGLLMAFVLVVCIAMFVALRVLGGREVDDHPAPGTPDPTHRA